MNEEALLAILRQGGRTIDERQARLDCAEIIRGLPIMTEYEKRRPGKRRSRSRAFILADMAQDVYYHHTGKDPGRTINGGRAGGLFFKFVTLLACAAGLTPADGSVPNACQQVRRVLNKRADLGPLPSTSKAFDPNNRIEDRARLLPARASKRARLLTTHIAGYEDEEGLPVEQPQGRYTGTDSRDPMEGDGHTGWPVFGGYEPAPDRSQPARRVFAAALRNARKP